MRYLFTALTCIVFVGLFCLGIGCNQPYIANNNTVTVEATESPSLNDGNVVKIVITNKGVAKYNSVKVIDFHENGRAEAIYEIHNDATFPFRPIIEIEPYIDVAKYEEASEAGYVKAPQKVYDWIQIPEMMVIQPNQIGRYVIALEMPKGETIEEDKIAYRTVVSYETGNTLVMAVGVWWLIDIKE